MSLFAFTSETDKLVLDGELPLYDSCLRSIAINEGGAGGTNFYKALEDISKDDSFKTYQKPKSVILLSDGGDIAFQGDTNGQKREFEEAIVKLIGNPEQKNMRILTVGMGTERGWGEVPDILYQGKKCRRISILLCSGLSAARREESITMPMHTIQSTYQRTLARAGEPRLPILSRYEEETHYYLDPAGEYFIYDSSIELLF